MILREGGDWRLWYTGYDPARGGTMKLGYATSRDGRRFTRHPGNPVFDAAWTEDVFVVKHEGVYHMFAEGRGVWLARSEDLRVFTNVQDEPVIARGPDAYDRHAVALNQVVRYRGRYYGVYHANADPDWKGPWTTCLAASEDLLRWEKYPGNPVVRSDDSSGILVGDGAGLRLYTMHPAVKLWLPRER